MFAVVLQVRRDYPLADRKKKGKKAGGSDVSGLPVCCCG